MIKSRDISGMSEFKNWTVRPTTSFSVLQQKEVKMNLIVMTNITNYIEASTNTTLIT